MLDKMTPIERGRAIASGQAADRMPCNPNIANGVARIYGCKISEFNYDAKTLAMAQAVAYRRFGYDSIRVFTDLFPCAEAMGAKVKYPDDDTADLEAPAITDVRQIDSLKVADPYTDGRLPVQLEAMKYLLDEVGDEINCTCSVVGAFTNSFSLMGTSKVLSMMKKDPENVHRLCRKSLDTIKAYAAAAMDIGLTPTISEPMSSCTVVSPKDFRTFSMPYLKELVDFIKSRGKGVILHICGQTNKIWKDLGTLGIDALSIDNVASIAGCKETIGDKTKIFGNVDPGSIMYCGSKLDVRLKTLECIRDGYDSPKGFMVMSGCSLPVETPPENIDEMLNTVREVGYPVSPERVNSMLDDVRKKITEEEGE